MLSFVNIINHFLVDVEFLLLFPYVANLAVTLIGLWGSIEWNNMAQVRDRARALVKWIGNLRVL